MTYWIVTVCDKELRGEPDVGLAIVEGEEGSALQMARGIEDDLRSAGRCRCVASVRKFELGRAYRVGALVRSSDLLDRVTPCYDPVGSPGSASPTRSRGGVDRRIVMSESGILSSFLVKEPSSPDRTIRKTVVVDFSLSEGDLALILSGPADGEVSSDRPWKFRIVFPPVMAERDTRMYRWEVNEIGEGGWERIGDNVGVSIYVVVKRKSDSVNHTVTLWPRHVRAIAVRKLLEALIPGVASETRDPDGHVAIHVTLT